jgi:hypothetical protein
MRIYLKFINNQNLKNFQMKLLITVFTFSFAQFKVFYDELNSADLDKSLYIQI